MKSPKPRIYFIHGLISLTPSEFRAHYLPLIQKALELGDRFLIGDSPYGADQMAQDYLSRWPDRVTVHHIGASPRYLASPAFSTRGKWLNGVKRDVAMLHRSTHDIAWVRPGCENSHTAKNLRRRPGIQGEKLARQRKAALSGISA